jgi:hypothetical protein
MIDFITYFTYVSVLASSVLLCGIKQNFALSELSFESTSILRIQHFMVLLIISIVVGFRYQVGVDWESYKEVFFHIKNNPSIQFFDQTDEPGFFYINKIIAGLGLGYQWMFFTVAFISWFFLFKSVPKTILPFFIFFLFADEYFFWGMNGVRQFVAIGIFLFSIHFIINRNFWYFLISVFIASLFHYSALLLIPIYFIPFSRFYNQKFWFLAFAVSFFFSQSIVLVNGLKQFLIYLTQFIPIIHNYVLYVETELFEARELAGSGLGVIFKTIITLFILYFSKRIVEKYPQTKVYFILFFVGAIINNLFFTFQIIGRINVYFLIIRNILLATIIFEILKGKYSRYVAIGILTLYFLLFLVSIYNSSNQCSPYSISL